MRTLRLVPGRPADPALEGAVLVRDLVVDGRRWSKGHRLSAGELTRLADPAVRIGTGSGTRPAGQPGALTVLLPDPDDVHEDEAALRLAAAVAGPGVVLRGPAESRVDLVAAADGILHVRSGPLARLDRIDPLEVFTLYDGQAVRAGDLVASVKVAPHVVPAAILDRGVRLAERSRPLVRVAPFLPRRVAVVVKQSIRAVARDRFEASVRDKVVSLGSEVASFSYVADEPEAVAAALRPLVRGRGHAAIVLTAGGASTDPADPFFVAIAALGGRVVRRGAPAHPGSMLWLARIGPTDLLGMPTCGAYSRATAVDLVLPRLLTGERAGPGLVAGLGHGGVLNRAMRFRFPPYARELDAPEG